MDDDDLVGELAEVLDPGAFLTVGFARSDQERDGNSRATVARKFAGRAIDAGWQPAPDSDDTDSL